MGAMNLMEGDQGPCQLLFVSRRNLAEIVQRIAPDLVLIPKEKFNQVAAQFLGIIEDVVARPVPSNISEDPPHP